MKNSSSSTLSLKNLPPLAAIEAEIRRRRQNKILTFFPDAGPCRRELYPRHIEFITAGATYKERLFMAANRVGKSETGAYETACHLTGKYPDWWPGKRFTEPIECWACGTTSETTRDIVQAKLLGSIDAPGTGMVAGHLIGPTFPRRSGLAGSIETAWIRHTSGGLSRLGLKTYEQGRTSFEGTAKHLIWCDEEPPEDVYTEMLYRTVTTRGIVLVTFTPLKGMSDVVKGFIEPEKEEAREFKWYIQAGWSDVPHIDEQEKKVLIATTPPYQLKARTLGEPSLGAGAIYPIAEEEITCPPMAIPDSWPRVYGMDVGWNRTAVIWGARDPGSGVIYLYSEHYQGQGEPASHAAAVRARGDWVRGVIDPAANGRSQEDGRQLIVSYRALGLQVVEAVNTVEAGITELWQAMLSGRIKVFTSCQNWLREFRKYHRDDKGNGKIVKKDDHLMDATRYLWMSGRDRMGVKPKPKPPSGSPRPAKLSAWS